MWSRQVGQYARVVASNMTAMPTLITDIERTQAWAMASIYTMQGVAQALPWAGIRPLLKQRGVARAGRSRRS